MKDDNATADCSTVERASTDISKQNAEIYETTELVQQRFSTWSVIGIQFSCSAAPLTICSLTYVVSGVGGTPCFFWCYWFSDRPLS